jgi:hypothetical protein
MVLSACGGTATTYSEHESELAVFDTCQKSVKKELRDPDSAKFGDDWKAWIVTHHDKPPRVSTDGQLRDEVVDGCCGRGRYGAPGFGVF